MPMIVVLPLFSLWFGYSGAARIATIDFRGDLLHHHQRRRRRALGARASISRSRARSAPGRLRTLIEIVLPASMPYLLAGLRLAAGRALIGAVVAEFFLSVGGLGYFILYQFALLPSQRGLRRCAAAGGLRRRLRIAGELEHAALPALVPPRRKSLNLQGKLMDNQVKAAIAHWGPRFVANGVVLTDFEEVTGALASYDDWCRAWSARAAHHEQLGREALAKKHFLTAGECLQRAGVYYHFASFLFVHDQAQMKAAHLKAIECRQAALAASKAARRARRNPLSGQDARRHFAQTCRRRKAAGGGDGGWARLDQGGNRRLRDAVPGARHGDTGVRRAGPGRGAIRFPHPRRLRGAGQGRARLYRARGAISMPSASACGASASAAITRRARPPSTSASRPASRSAGRSTGAKPGAACRN